MTAADEVLARARAVAPVLEGCAAEADRLRRLPEAAARAMADAGLFRIAVAEEAGGDEAEPLTNVRAIEAVSAANGSAGWNLMIGLEVAGIASGVLSPGALAEAFADPAMIMAGAINARGEARPVDGGYRLSGRWPYVSGCHNAQWFWFGTRLAGDTSRDPRRQVEMLIPARDVTILDTWDTAGMRGSGSHDVEVHDVFVPAHRVTTLYGDGMRLKTPLFRYPLFARLQYNKTGVSLGIARAALDAFRDLAANKTPTLSGSLLRERAQAQLAMAEGEALVRASRAWLFETVGELWADVCDGKTPTQEQRVRHRLAAVHCIMSCVRAVQLVHAAAGITVNHSGHPLERHFRDIHVVPQHITVTPAVYEWAGRAMLGAEFPPGSF